MEITLFRSKNLFFIAHCNDIDYTPITPPYLRHCHRIQKMTMKAFMNEKTPVSEFSGSVSFKIGLTKPFLKLKRKTIYYKIIFLNQTVMLHRTIYRCDIRKYSPIKFFLFVATAYL